MLDENISIGYQCQTHDEIQKKHIAIREKLVLKQFVYRDFYFGHKKAEVAAWEEAAAIAQRGGEESVGIPGLHCTSTVSFIEISVIHSIN